MRRRSLIAASLLSMAVLAMVGCGDDTLTGTDTICALNEDFERLNERTWDVIPPTGQDEPIPARYSSLLEENWVEGVKLMRRMVEHAPDAIDTDLSTYTEAQAKMSEMYAEYDYIQADVWQNADYGTWRREYPDFNEVRARIREWFTENCGMDLQG